MPYKQIPVYFCLFGLSGGIIGLICVDPICNYITLTKRTSFIPMENRNATGYKNGQSSYSERYTNRWK